MPSEIFNLLEAFPIRLDADCDARDLHRVESSGGGQLELSTRDLARAIPPTPSLDVAPSDHLGD